MLDSQSAAMFARCRSLALEAARTVRREAFSARAVAGRPGRPLAAYKPDLTAVPSGLVRSLQAAIDAIERHDRAGSAALVRSSAAPSQLHRPALSRFDTGLTKKTAVAR